MTTRSRITPGDGDPRHGTNGGYINHKCRCPDCKAAHARYQRAYLDANPDQREKGRERGRKRRERLRQERIAQGWIPPEDRPPPEPRPPRQLRPCGTRAAWFRHRRRGEWCEACDEANLAYNRERARRRRENRTQ